MRAVRYYVDADLLALAKSLVAARYDVTYPGDPGDRTRARPPCPVTSAATKDPDWIPVVAKQGWVVISRDRRITKKPAEIKAVKDNRLRIIVLDTRRDPTTWGEMGVVVSQRAHIESVTLETGPCAYLATRTTFRRLHI